MGAVSEAIAVSARAAGRGDLHLCPRQPSARRGRTGRRRRAGEWRGTPGAASNPDPKPTFLRLVEKMEFDPEFRWSRERFRVEGTSLKMNPALDGLPDFRALPGAPRPQHGATMHICPSLDYVERAWDDAKYGRPSQNPLLEMTCATVYDPERLAHHGHLPAIRPHAPCTLRDDANWDDPREPYGDRVLDVISEYAPNIHGIVRERQVLTPLDPERRFGVSEGNIFHGEMSLDQVFFLRSVAGWARYAAPIPGLYLRGPGAHPGGGVMGAPGYNAARRILKTS